MRHPYPDIPSTGSHRGDEAKTEVTSSVRAQDPPSQKDASARMIEPVYQLTRHGDREFYRIRAWSTDIVDRHEEAAEEIGLYHSPSELRSGLSQIPGPPRFAVFEDTRTGEIFVDRDRDVSGDWTDSGRFDQVTIFSTEDEAKEYVQRSEAKS